MHILLTGLSHKTAPVEIRERVAFTKNQLLDALSALGDRTGGGVILSTCNRTEVYSVTDSPDETGPEVQGFIADFHALDRAQVSPHLYNRTGPQAVRHLFRVASGLDSMILGESEILGQVREALTVAADSGSLRAPASRLFHRAIRTGRRVRDETELGRNALSISYAAVQLAQQVLGDLRGMRVLLVGAGDAGQLVAKALRTSGAADVIVANRTLERSEELARSLDGRAVPFAHVGLSLADVDIAIAATEAPGYVLTAEAVASAADARTGRPLFLFDLSIPRNIDPDADSLDDVSLFNIDHLSAIAEQNLRGRGEAVAEAERIVDDEVARFMLWWDSLEALPVIKALRQQAEGVRSRELARAVDQMPELSDREVARLDAMTRSIINRLLHDPTVALKRQSSDGLLQSVRELFNLRHFTTEDTESTEKEQE
jgi:glutamyl-tRNA reductase